MVVGGGVAEVIGDPFTRREELGDGRLQNVLGHSEPAENGSYTGVEARLSLTDHSARGVDQSQIMRQRAAHNQAGAVAAVRPIIGHGQQP
jgi:hypothetical protein